MKMKSRLTGLFARRNYADFAVPAEFAEQESIWLAWPQFEPIAGQSNIPQILSIIAAVSPHEFIDLIVNNQHEEQLARNRLIKAGIDLSQIRFHTIKHTDFWMRDVGAIFSQNQQGERAVVKFGFNGWGMGAVSKSFKKAAKIDANISRFIAKKMKLPVISSKLVAEGGALEINGDGTLITTESVILQPQRNPGITKEYAEAELKRVLGVRKIIWLKQGIAADDSVFNGPLQTAQGRVYTALATNGHTDEFVRWVNDDTVLLAEVTADEAARDALASETRQRLEDAYAILSRSTTASNKRINIIRIPVAEEIYKKLKLGDSTFDAVIDMNILHDDHQHAATFVSATSYLNYLVTNKIVLIPQYWQIGRSDIMRVKDETAARALQAAFPNRKVVAIPNIENLNIGGGGIHCITQQMPLRKVFA